ncbi:MAG: sulfatase-like hydrolase/transferase [Acidimicrobiia bacterium]|nr:sulfatase-like hydrolase/transferase [Acidimicrobiia bacterium]
MSTTRSSATRRSPAERRAVSELRAFLEIFALCGFAIAQPVLDVFGKAPSEFVFRGAGAADIVVFGLIVTFVPALILWVIEAVVGLVNRRARRWAHTAFLAVLAGLFVLLLVKEASGLRGLLLAVLALAAGAGFGYLYLRVESTRTWLAYASIAPLLFLGLFLFSSPVSKLLGGNEAEAAQLDGIENPAPVVLVILDEFPLASLIDADGELDSELYPNFTRFTEEGTWYRNATAVTQYTGRSIPAILTGRYPQGQDDPLASDHPENLFTLLGDSYDLSVSESTTRLCPTNLCGESGTAGPTSSGGLGGLLDDARGVWRTQVGLEDSDANATSGFVDDTDVESNTAVAEAEEDQQELPNALGEAAFPQPERFEFLLDSVTNPGAHLSYLHILLPHVPYRYLPDGRLYPGPENQPGDVDNAWIDDPAPVDLARQRELLQIRYVDSLLGDLIDTMKDAGTWDDALVMITADHGSAFIPGESLRGTGLEDMPDALYPQIAWVPLFVHYPGQSGGDGSGSAEEIPPAGEISDANVEGVDLLPTIADVLGAEIPWGVDGFSMLDTDARPTDEKTFYEAKSGGGHVDARERLTFNGADYFPDVLAQGVESILPAVGDPLRSYRIGEGVDLVGMSADNVDVVDPSVSGGVTGTLDQDLLERDVDPDAGSIPVYLSGHVEGLNEPATVAVGLNGRIGGVARTFEWDGHDHFFGVMLPPEFLVAGPNDIQLFLVRDGDLILISPGS